MILERPRHEAVTLAVPSAAAACALVSLSAAGAASLATLASDASFPAAGGFNSVLAEARGWSAVTFGLALPLGVASVEAAAHGSLRGRLVAAGVMAYLAYTYLEIAVAPPFSSLYLLYVLAFGTAIPALLMLAASIPMPTLSDAIGDRAPRRAIAGFCLTFSVGLVASWLPGILRQTAAGRFGYPTGADAVGHVVHALDLGLVVPLGVATAALLWLRRTEGYLLAAITLAFALIMGWALVGMVGTSALLHGDSTWIVAPFLVIPVVAWFLGMAFFRAVREPARPRRIRGDGS